MLLSPSIRLNRDCFLAEHALLEIAHDWSKAREEVHSDVSWTKILT